MPVPTSPGQSDDRLSSSGHPCLAFEQDEAAFYEALRADSQRAWECLYSRITASFVPYAAQRSAIPTDDIYDIMQDSLADFAVKLRDGRYQYQGRPVAAYLFIVCRNRWVSFLKKKHLMPVAPYRELMADEERPDQMDGERSIFSLTPGEAEHPATDTSRSPAEGLPDDVDWEAIDRAFSELSADCQTLLRAFYVDDMSLRDCAALIGLQENSAKVKRFRCAQRLRTLYMTYRKED